MSAAALLDRHSARWTAATAVAATLPLALLMPAGVQALFAACFLLGIASAWSGRHAPRWLRLLLTAAAIVTVLMLFQIGFGSRVFGRDAGSALLAAMLGIKLLELQQLRDARSAVSFSAFALMAAFLQDQGPLTLALAVCSGLLLLASLGRIADAESPDPTDLEARGDLLRRGHQALRLAALSLPLATVGFFLFPRLASPLWGLPQNSLEARTGLSDEMSPGDISKLFIDDTPVLRISFEGAIPEPADRYFRGPVMSEFDGRRWRRSFIGNNRPAALDAGSPAFGYEIEQEPTERRNLFALDLPTAAPVGSKLTYERSILLDQPQTRLLRQLLTSVSRYRFEPTLPRTLRRHYLELPDGFNPRSRREAQAWRDAGADPDAMIARALQWFNAEFTYTLDPPLLGRDSVDDFLFVTRRGYCEHFSSAFVVLMRAAGIPARVVTGYQGGRRNPVGNYLLVLQSDAHAWAEVWLDGRGWVRVDPTSAVSPARIERGSSSLRDGSAIRDYLLPLRNTVDWLRRGWNDFVLGYNASRQRELLRPFGIDEASAQQIAVALVVCAGLGLALTLAFMLRGPRDTRDPLQREWQRLLRRLARRGHAKPAAEPPLSFGLRMAALLPRSGGELAELARRYSDWQYAAPTAEAETEALRRALRNFRLRD